MSTRSDFISKIPLFAGLDAEELESIAARAVERRYEPDESLFWEGDRAEGLFLLVEGSVKIFKTAPSGREMMLDMIAAPSSVAELPLFDGGPYPASVRAVKPAVALFLHKSDFHQACRQNPNLPLKILAVVGRRLRTLVNVVESITFGSVTKRLAKLLLESGASVDAESPNGTTPLMLAARHAPEATVELLLQRGADSRRRNQRGLQAIDFAEAGGRDYLVERFQKLPR